MNRMKRGSGEHAVYAAVGAEFLPVDPAARHAFGWCGVRQEDGTVLVAMRHKDGRQIDVYSRPGNGWHLGRMVRAEATGDGWRLDGAEPVTDRLSGVRAWLLAHEPDREEVYDGQQAARQPRALDGRERDIICRILRDLINLARDGKPAPVYVDGKEWARRIEARIVLYPRDN